MSVVNNSSMVTFEIQVNGTTIPNTVEVVSIHIENSLNEVPSAQIVVVDGDAATQEFPISSSDLFAFGTGINIKVGYDAKNTQLFSGIITGQALNFGQRTSATLEIQCSSPAIKMTGADKDVVYKNQTVTDIIKTIVSNYEGLSANVVGAADVIPEVLQDNQNDWDFMISLAEAYGLVVTVNGTKINVSKPNADSSPILELTYGENILAFNAEINAINKLSQIEENPLSRIQGTAKIEGYGDIEPNCNINLRGLGNNFSGNQYVSGVAHVITSGTWYSMVTIGLSETWFPMITD